MSHVMIVDDDRDILRLVKTGLAKAGFQVSQAENAETALAKIAQKKPDLLITDAMMPGKDGYELSKELRARAETASLPIIMLTALHEEQDALKAFQDGVDDFVTKPFNMAILRARVAAMLARAQAFKGAQVVIPTTVIEEVVHADRVSTGIQDLDSALDGGILKGSNMLVMGETGTGKSSLARRFTARGLANQEKCMVITLDDDPVMIRQNLGRRLTKSLSEYEQRDCYSWSRGLVRGSEKFALSGAVELNQLAGVISDAGAELGQTATDKLGGRRIVDSMSSLFINFELASVQRFLAQLARSASSYGGVSTLFILEEGSVSDQVLNNIKYLMDGIIELKFEGGYMARVASMKWSKFSRQWVTIED
jgi:CheY-like chemotaxis protein/KaiC/GvpD/RAD55 family RecA-like ATPase